MGAFDYGSLQLVPVAFHMALDYVVKLIDGYGSVPGDSIALADCPVEPKDIRRLRDRAARIRNLVLHLRERQEPGTSVNLAIQAEALPRMKWSIDDRRRGASNIVDLTDAEILSMLDALDPWLHKHWERLVAA